MGPSRDGAMARQRNFVLEGSSKTYCESVISEEEISTREGNLGDEQPKIVAMCNTNYGTVGLHDPFVANYRVNLRRITVQGYWTFFKNDLDAALKMLD